MFRRNNETLRTKPFSIPICKDVDWEKQNRIDLH